MNQKTYENEPCTYGWFPLDNNTLKRANLLGRKGARVFDVKGFTELIENLGQKSLRAPLFDRSSDEVVKNARKIPAEQEYIIAEGNYLLLKQDSGEIFIIIGTIRFSYQSKIVFKVKID